MKCSAEKLFTPLYLKLEPGMPWPEEPVFYLLAREGLFVCRQNRFFTSCCPGRKGPGELASQEPFLHLNYPLLPRTLLERIVGFFDRVARMHGSEAAALLAWDEQRQRVVPIVPPQIATVARSYFGLPVPMDVEYQMPSLPPHLALIGDVHCHVDAPAYSSFTDQADELHRPGLHLVVGRIWDEPPQFHCEAVADGMRFQVRDLEQVIEGYQRRRREEVPEAWMEQVTVKTWSTFRSRRDDPAENAKTSRATGAGWVLPAVSCAEIHPRSGSAAPCADAGAEVRPKSEGER